MMADRPRQERSPWAGPIQLRPPRALDGASLWWWLIVGAVALGLWLAIGETIAFMVRL